MEPFEKFIENWIKILTGQVPVYLLLISMVFIFSFLIPLAYWGTPGSFYENRLKSGFAIAFLTRKGALSLGFALLIYLYGTALVIGPLFSIIRWALDFPLVNVIIYYILGLATGYVLYMLILMKYHMRLSRAGYYLGSEWLILKIFTNHILVPINSIETLEIDPENLFVKIKYRTKVLYFFTLKSGWIFTFKDKQFYEKTITALTDYSIPSEQKNLKTRRLRLTKYYVPLIEQKSFSIMEKLPAKLQSIIQQEKNWTN